MGGDWIITEKSPIDPTVDLSWGIGPNGFGSTSYQPEDVHDAITTLKPALKAYADANNGAEPKDPAEVVPYLTTPEQKAAYALLLKTRAAKTNGK
jgi:hypothetical protein